MRVLVVEDHLQLAELIVQRLQEEGFAVDHVASGEDATWMANENDFDAIVLDVLLPGMDGFEVCQRIREQGRWAPILMLTAKDAVHDRVRGLDAGADDYLTKPFSFAELLARLRALVRRGAGERPAVLVVDDLTLDPASHEVRRGDVQVDLTAKEFSLLEYLMRHPREALSRTNLIEHVWDFGFDGDFNIVEVYIRHLREKIDRPFGLDSIETIRGVGYRLRCEEAP